MAVIPITANKASHRYGDSTLPRFAAPSSVAWSTNSGIINPLVGTFTTLTPVNQTRIVTINASANGGADTGTAAIQIYATFPLQPNYGYEVEMDDKTLISVAEDGSAVFRVKGDVKRTWQLQMPNRPLSEYQILRDFWNYHRKFTSFYYVDLALSEEKLVRFDSGIKVTPQGPDQISMNCLVREV